MSAYPITTIGVLNSTLCDKVCQLLTLRQVGAFLQVLWFPPPIKLTAMHDIHVG